MLKKLIPLLLLFAIASSGCIDLLEGDPESREGDGMDMGATEPDHDGMDHDMDDPDDEGDPQEDTDTNQAPEASLSANVTEGQAPLQVKITVSASDADGDGLEWTLDLGDGEDPVTGDALDTEIETTFDQVGNFTVVLNVSDGMDTTEEELVVRVVDTPGPVQTFTGGWMATVPVYCAPLAGPGADELMGVFTNGTLVDEASVGLGFTANFTTETSDGVLDFIVHFVNTEDEEVVETFMAPPGEDVTGTVPANADMVYFSGCGISGAVDVIYAAG